MIVTVICDKYITQNIILIFNFKSKNKNKNEK